MAVLGKTTNGGSEQSYTSDRKLVSLHVAETGGVVTGGKVRIRTSSAVNVPSKMVIYSSTAGEPDALLATSDETVFNSNTEIQVTYTFSGAEQITLVRGTSYWIGVIYDYTSSAVLVSRDNTAGMVRSNNDTYSDGATSTFGATATTNGKIDAYIEYTETSAGSYPELSYPVSTQFATSVTSMAVNMPTNIVAGEYLIAFVEVRNSGTWTVPTDWNEFDAQIGGGSVGELTAFWKIADGSEGTTVTWTASTGTTAVWQVMRGINCDTTVAPESDTTSGDATSADPPNLAPSWGSDDNLFIAVAGHSASSTGAFTAPPTNYVNFLNSGASSGGSAVSLATATRELTASSDNPSTFTAGGSNRWWASMTVALKPASSGTPADDSRPATTIGNDSANDSRPSTTLGVDTSNDSRPSVASGVDTANDSRSATLLAEDGSTATDDSREAITTGSDSANSDIDSTVHGADTSNDSRESVVVGQDSANDSRPAVVQGSDSANDSREGITHGQDTSSDSRDSVAHGTEGANNSREATTHGLDQSSDSRESTVIGNDSANASRESIVSGIDSASDERSVTLNSQDTANDQRSAVVIGNDSVTSERPATTSGQDSANDNRDASTHGKQDSSDERVSTLNANDTANDNRSSVIMGVEGSEDSRNAKVVGVVITSDSREGNTRGIETTSSNINAKSTGSLGSSSSIKAGLVGKRGDMYDKDNTSWYDRNRTNIVNSKGSTPFDKSNGNWYSKRGTIISRRLRKSEGN